MYHIDEEKERVDKELLKIDSDIAAITDMRSAWKSGRASIIDGYYESGPVRVVQGKDHSLTVKMYSEVLSWLPPESDQDAMTDAVVVVLNDKLASLKGMRKMVRARWYSFRQGDTSHNMSLQAYLDDMRTKDLIRSIDGLTKAVDR